MSWLIGGGLLFLVGSLRGAEPWVSMSDGLLQQALKQGGNPEWPGGCSGVVVDRSSGTVTVKVVGLGLWQSRDEGHHWTRLDGDTVSGRDETGWATSVDQDNPTRMASFSLDGFAGWTPDGSAWTRFTSLGRNWDYGSVDWSAPVPRTIIAARHETTPAGEVYLSQDGGTSWRLLPIRVSGNRGQPSMVGALDATTLIYGNGSGIVRSTNSGSTWTKVSDFNPQTRIPVRFRGRYYLGSQNGLHVSGDLGTSWSTQGKAVDVWQGPFFGRDEGEMLVVGKEGAFLTRDAGENWIRIAGLKPKEAGFLFTPNWFGCYAWDPVHNLLYASSMGNTVYRLKL